MSKRIFRIPVSWEVCGIVEIEAEDLDSAIRTFDELERNGCGVELPESPNYIDGSFRREDLEICKIENDEEV